MTTAKRSPTELLQAVGGFLTVLGTVTAAIVGYLGWIEAVLPASVHVSSLTRNVVATAILAPGLFIAWRILRPRSRLANAEALWVQADRPEHLVGRTEDIRLLMRACQQHGLVYLVGESGGGKTALVKAGLIPGLNDFHPVYLDIWGEEWDTGPTRSLREALVRSLKADDLQAIAAGGLDDTSIFPALQKLSPKLGRRPLVVLDQFDDYQNAHRDRFLVDNAWINSDTLVLRNRFWQQLGSLVRAGDIHVLVVTRADAADGLESVRLTDKPSVYRLYRLGRAVVELLLDRLTLPRDGQPAAIENPEGGWLTLRTRLAADLAEEGGVLPARMRLVFAGLGNLRPLSVAALEKVGGIHALEAAQIRRHVLETARSSGLAEAAVRKILVSLVEGSKTVQRTLPAICAITAQYAAGQDGLRRTEAALANLVTQEIVRELPANGAGEATYLLTHDYLCAAVLEIDREANRWLELLNSRTRAFADASTFARKWDALMPPTLSLRLLGHRLRGEFRYSSHRGFALKSLLKMVPSFAVLCTALALAYAFNDNVLRNEVSALHLPADVADIRLESLVIGAPVAGLDWVRRPLKHLEIKLNEDGTPERYPAFVSELVIVGNVQSGNERYFVDVTQLPPALTSLTLLNVHLRNAEHLSSLTSLKHLKVKGVGERLDLPASIESVEADSTDIRFDAAKQIRSLTLHPEGGISVDASGLPASLTHLSLVYTTLIHPEALRERSILEIEADTDDFLGYLPPSLQKLSLNLAQVDAAKLATLVTRPLQSLSITLKKTTPETAETASRTLDVDWFPASIVELSLGYVKLEHEQHLAALSNLRRISLDDTYVESTDLPQGIEEVSAHYGGLDDAGLRTLPLQLTAVAIDGFDDSEAKGMTPFQRFKHLRRLSVGDLVSVDFKQLPRNLEELSVGAALKENDDALSEMKDLRELTLDLRPGTGGADSRPSGEIFIGRFSASVLPSSLVRLHLTNLEIEDGETLGALDHLTELAIDQMNRASIRLPRGLKSLIVKAQCDCF